MPWFYGYDCLHGLTREECTNFMHSRSHMTIDPSKGWGGVGGASWRHVSTAYAAEGILILLVGCKRNLLNRVSSLVYRRVLR